MDTPSTSKNSEQFMRPPPPQAPWCLFLDIDGTLVDIAPAPDAVEVDAALLDLLRRLARACDAAIALIIGRPIAAVDSLFAPLRLRCDRRGLAVSRRAALSRTARCTRLAGKPFAHMMDSGNEVPVHVLMPQLETLLLILAATAKKNRTKL